MTALDTRPALALPTLMANADLQDDLLVIRNDVARLQTLLDDSHAHMQAGFFGLLALLPDAAVAQAHVARAVKALQFQDLATQLITHTASHLRHCTDRLAQDAFGSDDEGDGEALVEPAPRRANPVTQSELDTGFIELF